MAWLLSHVRGVGKADFAVAVAPLGEADTDDGEVSEAGADAALGGAVGEVGCADAAGGAVVGEVGFADAAGGRCGRSWR